MTIVDKDGNTWIMREVIETQPFRIPKDHVVCPDCKGTGKILVAYNDPGPNTYWNCITCLGEGHLTQESLKDGKSTSP
jgi:DnaJ-class molecular chaperone